MKITKRMGMFLLNMLLPVLMMAQGWPANYQGVMLQGFYWDSYEDTKWTNLTAQADELSKYFKLIWVPNSGQTKEDRWNSAGNWGFENMGYMPVYWLKHNTCFGTEAELKTMINTFKAKGTGFIEDVVINHKNGLTNWADFPNEDVTVGGVNYKLTWATNMSSLWGICSGDELYSNGGEHDGTTYVSDGTASADEGDNFDGCRDLDHTNATVQNNIKTYLSFLKQELGYVGYRYDMVKGYAGYYVGMYNDYSTAVPEFSVGEYWDASYSNTVGWINDTKLYGNASSPRSAAFDFPLKYKLNDAFNNNNWGVLSDKGIAGDPNMSRYSVTFVDNHDTYRNDYDRVNNNVLAANAFILALPGTPCIFLPHWQNKLYKTSIKKMIAARNVAGISNQSTITAQYELDGGYYMKVTGQNGSVIVLCGQPNNPDLTDHTLVCSGDNFAFYLWNGVYTASTFSEIEEEDAKDITIYVKDNNQGAPYLYVWDGDRKFNGNFPGQQLSQTTTLADGSQWYKQTFHTTSINAIVSFNDGHQSSNIEGITEDLYICYWKGDDGKYADYTSFYESYDGSTHYDVYFDNPWGSNGRIWAWSTKFYDVNDKNFTGGTWPGASMTKVGTSSSGNDIYRWRMPVDINQGVPNMVLFSNNGNDQTSNFNLTNNAYYTTGGLNSVDRLSFYPAFVLENANSTTATNYNGSSEAVAQLTKEDNKNNMSQTIYYPAGTYTVQAIVRGTVGKTVSLSAGTASNSVTLTGMEANSASTVATSGIVEDGTNNGWLKVQATYTLEEEGALKINLTSDANTWQVGALTIIKDANANGKFHTTATTTARQTWVDMTGQSNFSFFELGVNKNALVKSNSAILSKNNVVNGTCANLKLTDGAYDFGAGEAFTATNIDYDRAFVENRKVTVCLPFAVTAAELTAMNAKAYKFTGIVNGNVKFTEVTEMAANTPYVFVSSSNQTPFASLGSKSITATPNAMEVTHDGVTFTGSMTRQTLNDGTTHYYGYSGGDFVKVGSNVGINPFRAYLKTTESLGAKLQVVFNDEVDGISLTTDLTSTDEGSNVYDISGRIIQSNKVTKSLSNEVTKSQSSTLPKGIYIVREGHGANAKTRKIIIK